MVCFLQKKSVLWEFGLFFSNFLQISHAKVRVKAGTEAHAEAVEIRMGLLEILFCTLSLLIY